MCLELLTSEIKFSVAILPVNFRTALHSFNYQRCNLLIWLHYFFLSLFYFREVLPMLSFFQSRSIKQVTTFRGPIQIGDSLKINVWGYTKVILSFLFIKCIILFLFLINFKYTSEIYKQQDYNPKKLQLLSSLSLRFRAVLSRCVNMPL